jgi:hypothetical protein
MTPLLWLALAVIAADGAPPDGWQTFTSTKGHYSVLLPAGRPRERELLKLEEAEPTGRTTTAFSQEGIAYTVVEYASTGPIPASSDPGGFLDSIAATLTSETGDKLLSKRAINLSGNPGLEVSVEYAPTLSTRERVVVMRLFLIDRRRSFMVAAKMPKEKYPSSEATRFLDSFKLTDESSGSGKSMAPKATDDYRVNQRTAATDAGKGTTGAPTGTTPTVAAVRTNPNTPVEPERLFALSSCTVRTFRFFSRSVRNRSHHR